MTSNIAELTAQIVSAYIKDNQVSPDELPEFISKIRASLEGNAPIPANPAPVAIQPQSVTIPELAPIPTGTTQKPFCSIEESQANNDYVICLEDGHRGKVLTGYIKRMFGLTPEEYKRKWNLPADYSLVSRNYAKHRSGIARDIGLGTGLIVKRTPKEIEEGKTVNEKIKEIREKDLQQEKDLHEEKINDLGEEVIGQHHMFAEHQANQEKKEENPIGGLSPEDVGLPSDAELASEQPDLSEVAFPENGKPTETKAPAKAKATVKAPVKPKTTKAPSKPKAKAEPKAKADEKAEPEAKSE